MAYIGVKFDTMLNNTDITAQMLEDNLKENGNNANVSNYEEEKFLVTFNNTGREYITDKSGNIIMSGIRDIPDEEKADLYIYDVATLSDFRDRVNSGENFEGKIIKVTKDIDYGEGNTTNWEPIGNGTTNFKGTFDGNGHTISNIYINATSGCKGFFRGIEASAELKNLVVIGNITSSDNVCGGICIFNYGIIENCANLINVKNTKTAGGIAGDNNGIIKNCYNSGNIISSLSFAGGIAGFNGVGTGAEGILGRTGYIYNCYNNALVNGKLYGGGITGSMASKNGTSNVAYGYIYNSYSIGNVNIYGEKNSGTVENCYTTDAYTELANLNEGIDGIDGKDTENPWVILGNVNEGYPILDWQVENSDIPIYTANQLIQAINGIIVNGRIYKHNENNKCILQNNIDVFLGYKDLIESNKIKLDKNGFNINWSNVGEFEYIKNKQEVTLPLGQYQIECWGASGGYSMANGKIGAYGGNGGYTKGILALYKTEKIYIYVGGHGSDAVVGKNSLLGYNGGGLGTWDNSDNEAAGAGGGATDIRLVSGNWNDFESLKSRIMVAAGGGGASWQTAGGAGGGLEGFTNRTNSQPGTQTTGYKFGIGQDGYGTGDNDGVAGSGGGYYGGTTSNIADEKEAGAGGSSFISGYIGCNAISKNSIESNIEHTGQANHYSGKIFTNAYIVDGKSSMPKIDGTGTEIGHSGNGYVKITKLEV